MIEQGQFGRVYHATLHKAGAGQEAGAVPAAVKKNIPFLSVAEFKAFLYELKLLIHLGHHDNVVELLGGHTARVGKRKCATHSTKCSLPSCHMLRHGQVNCPSFSSTANLGTSKHTCATTGSKSC